MTVSRTPQLSVTRFLAFGDSITAGEVTFPVNDGPPTLGNLSHKLVVVPSAAYPTVLRSLMTTRYATQAASIVLTNEGVPGESARGSATLARFSQAVASQRPNIVLLMDGYNDIGDGSVLTATAQAVNAMCAEARNRGARVFLATLAPSRPGFRAIPLSSVQGYNDRLREVARGENAVLVDVYAALLPEVNVNIGVDGLHPTETGYRRIAEAFMAAIQANLEVR